MEGSQPGTEPGGEVPVPDGASEPDTTSFDDAADALGSASFDAAASRLRASWETDFEAADPAEDEPKELAEHLDPGGPSDNGSSAEALAETLAAGSEPVPAAELDIAAKSAPVATDPFDFTAPAAAAAAPNPLGTANDIAQLPAPSSAPSSASSSKSGAGGDTAAFQAQVGGKKPRTALLAAVAAGIIAAVGGAWALSGDEPEAIAEAPIEPAAQTATTVAAQLPADTPKTPKSAAEVAPQMVRVRISASPTSAVIELDGKRVSNPYDRQVKAGGRLPVLIRAAGHKPGTWTLQLNEDRELNVALQAASPAPAKKAAPETVASTESPSAAERKRKARARTKARARPKAKRRRVARARPQRPAKKKRKGTFISTNPY